MLGISGADPCAAKNLHLTFDSLNGPMVLVGYWVQDPLQTLKPTDAQPYV